MRFNSRKQFNRGFTLVELILYVAILSVILIVVTSFLGIMLQNRVKNQTISEVEQQGMQVMELFTSTVRNSESITLPVLGGNGDTLTLQMADVGLNPTSFDESAGVFRITEGVGSPVNLTSQRIVVSDVHFYNMTREGRPGTIRIEFTLTHLNPQGRSEFDYSKVFYGSANIR